MPVDSETTPGQVIASVDVESIPVTESTTDIPDTNAVPVQQVATFMLNPLENACAINDPSAWGYMGQRISLQVIVDSSGQAEALDGVGFRQETANAAYNQFAECLLEQHWQFEPATMDGQPVTSDNLIVHITLDRG
jgi:hypothetical protein